MYEGIWIWRNDKAFSAPSSKLCSLRFQKHFYTCRMLLILQPLLSSKVLYTNRLKPWGIFHLCAHGPTVSFLCHCVTIPHRPLLNPSESAHPAGKRVVSRDGLGEVVYSLYLTSSVMDWWTELCCIKTSCKHRCFEPCFPACVSTWGSAPNLCEQWS